MERSEPWRALVTEYESGVGLAPDTPVDGLASDRGAWLAATLPVLDLAVGSVSALCRAARRAGATGPLVDRKVDPARVAAAFQSDRHLLLDGRPVDGFAPLSGFFRSSDGWLRTHANYPHHRSRLLRLLELHDGATRDELAARLTTVPGADVEEQSAAAGAIAVRVRTEAEWRASDPGRAAATGPLVRIDTREDVLPTRGGARALRGGPSPLEGIRVLDLTRVIAGPVGTRALAQLGADVLRIDPPVPAEIRWQHLDTGQGKRTALLDLHDTAERDRAQELLDGADVLVTGYRPGAIEDFGLRLPPGVVHARVNAWGDAGPWAGRRGFDSIVQAASGIAMVESPDGERPGALPAQALDHATGYLLAAGVVDALVGRAADARGRDVAVALARTAAWLLDSGARDPAHREPAVAGAGATVSHGRHPVVTTARPALPGHDDHVAPAHPWGTDPAGW